MELAWRITRRGGSTISAGLPHPDKRFALPPTQMVAEERILRGSYIGSAVPARDIRRYIELYRRGKLPVDRLMGERLALEDINRGFDRLVSGNALRDGWSSEATDAPVACERRTPSYVLSKLETSLSTDHRPAILATAESGRIARRFVYPCRAARIAVTLVPGDNKARRLA